MLFGNAKKSVTRVTEETEGALGLTPSKRGQIYVLAI